MIRTYNVYVHRISYESGNYVHWGQIVFTGRLPYIRQEKGQSPRL